MSFFVDLVGDILCGVDDVLQLTVFPLGDGIAVEVPPDGRLGGSLIESEIHVKMIDGASNQLCVEVVQMLGLLIRHAFEKILWRRLTLWYHLSIFIA